MDYSWARPGVWCECIKRGDWEEMRGFRITISHFPELGQRYQIQNLWWDDGGLYLKLAGFPRHVNFNASRFRPLTSTPSKAEQKARKELFDSWLNPDPIDATKIVTEDCETALMDLCAAYARDAERGRAF
jgi:hypothetical protein